MLRDLHIRDFALISDVWLEFGSGLSVLSGETGAGKTVLLSALELVLGGRGNTAAIRAGAQSALVEAQFEDDDTETVVSRSLNTKGRGRVVLDGELSTVGVLQERVGPLIDLHGQHEHQALLSSAHHLDYLDRWASADTAPLLASYQEAYLAYHAAYDVRTKLEASLAFSIETAEVDRLARAEIERVAPQAGEDDELRRRLPALQNAEALAEEAQAALTALRGEAAAIEQLALAEAALSRISSYDEIAAELRIALIDIQLTLDGIADRLQDYVAHIEHDPRVLEESFERLAALEGLTKRFGPTLDAVLKRYEQLLHTAELTVNSEEHLAEARKAETQAKQNLEAAATALSLVRHQAASTFTALLRDAAADLELGKVHFEFAFTPLSFERYTMQGGERGEILYAPAPEVPSRPLAKIASGGEISRVMLALKTVLGAADKTRVLIFDEIDAGIGGATGLAVGAKLKKLAATHQVIVVTHLAQVAAYADAHFVVSKATKESSTETLVVPLVDSEARTHEIARMLAGNTTAAALTHAQELLASVR